MSSTVATAGSNHRKARPDQPGYDETRERIIAAAIELMAERGPRRLRFDELSARVGLNRTTIYRYFDSKQDLVAACMVELMTEITEAVLRDLSPIPETTPDAFTDRLYDVICMLRGERRYTVIMDAQNIERFAQLSRTHMGEMTTAVLERYLTADVMQTMWRGDLVLNEVVHWVFHQIISYAFFGLWGEDEAAQKGYLRRMVVDVLFRQG